jgi:hypothetical protein
MIIIYFFTHPLWLKQLKCSAFFNIILVDSFLDSRSVMHFFLCWKVRRKKMIKVRKERRQVADGWKWHWERGIIATPPFPHFSFPFSSQFEEIIFCGPEWKTHGPPLRKMLFHPLLFNPTKQNPSVWCVIES